MTLRSIAIGIAAGLSASVLLMSSASGSVLALLLVGFTPLPLFAAGLAKGVRIAAIAALITVSVHFSISGLLGTGIFVLICAGPVVLLVYQALLWRKAPDDAIEWCPLGLLIHWSVLYGAAVFLAASAIAMASGSGLEARLARLMDVALSERVDIGHSAEIRAALEWFTAYPTTILSLWLVNLSVNGALAQALMSRCGWAIRPSPRMATLELPGWYGFVTIALVIVAYLSDGWLDFTVRNLLIVQGFAYLMAGLAVCHSWVKRFSMPFMPLCLIYGLAAMLVWPSLLIVFVGFIEQWAHLRRSFERSQGGLS